MRILRPSVKLLIIHSTQAAALQGHLMVICVPGIFPQAGQSSVKVVPRHATSPAERRGEEWWGVGYRGRGRKTLKQEDAQRLTAGLRS